MWSFGVILYILLGGYPPFHDDNQRTLFRKICKGDYTFHPDYWAGVSEDAKDLIKWVAETFNLYVYSIYITSPLFLYLH